MEPAHVPTARMRRRAAATRRRAAGRAPSPRDGAMRMAKAVGKYRIVGPLGHGGMATVYKAIDTTLERDVAIKILHRDRADPRIVTRFQSEATILAKLNHPEIATIYELFRSRYDLLLVMEFVHGETLESVCSRLGALPPPEAASCADKILSALDYAHGVGVVHCDIKPANVMMTATGAIKIMDFGTAHVRGAADATAPDGCTVGTPAYMSPEQLLGHEVDGRSDLYAVGVVLYRLLTGTLPFEGSNALEVAQRHIAQTPPPVQTRRDGLPDWCDAILQRALAKSATDRFQTAEDFREALRQATRMSAAELAQRCAIPVQPREAPLRSRPQPSRPAAATARAASTIVLRDRGRTRSMFRAVVNRRRRHILPTNRRAVAAGALAAVLVAGAALVTASTFRRMAEPPLAPARIAAPIVLRANAVETGRRRARDTTCRVGMAADALSVTAEDTNTLLHEVPYEDVLSVSRSHGVDPPVPASARIRGTAGVLRPGAGAVHRSSRGGAARDWVVVRTRKKNSELIVLRFDAAQDVRRFVAALEERIATPVHETREATR
jgi:serine/threonine-protein kinase